MRNPFRSPGATLTRDIVLNYFLNSPLIPIQLRWRLLRAYGLQIERSSISPKVWFGSSNISIGEGTFINYRAIFHTHGRISIGKNCDIAMDAEFITTAHEVGGPDRRAGQPVPRPISIGDGVWIGARALIMPGVTIGSGAVVAAGSVVTGDCEPNSLYAGAPAVLKKRLPTGDD